MEYADLSISSPDNYQKGIRSRKESCTTSFPIVLFDSSVLEFNVYLDVAEESGLKINVFDDNGKSEVSYWYNKSNNNYKRGWSTISIAINTNLTGYINLIGYSQDHEIVIVDSFQYITKPNVNSRIKDDILSDKIYETDGLLENIHEEIDLLFDHEGSGDEGSGEEYDLHLGEFEDDDLDEKGVTKIEE
ncbi:PREDICTED: uncharacterized protein LOC106119267 [Papilio xuthus]|uniref:Uncharacterized protein LOC106119267 n=1 Tax=Papilio xuthus TaxID=66420 RepID=A0AAJ7EAQ1_PAPXU|nr:PREDICTED: uncharacterized protein LOC106119267 [Papilio xuthus]